MKTPECDKLHKIKDKAQSIGEFLDWLVEYHYVSLPDSIVELLAEYFDVNLEKVEEEKGAILEELRKQEDKR